MKFIGSKSKRYFNEDLVNFIPDKIKLYVEPFGGSFAVGHRIEAETKVYNDINDYNLPIKADVIHHMDYKRIIAKYDSVDTVFYLDPPYHRKEFYYTGCEHYTKDFHFELKEIIDNIKGTVILSYNNHMFIKNLYSSKYNVHRCESTQYELIITKK